MVGATVIDDAYRVLVIDDDPDVAEYTRIVLEKRAGCRVRTVNDSHHATGAAAEFLPDVVVTDIEMPGMTGFDLMKQLRGAHPDLPVVVMTAHVSLEYAMQSFRSEADEFLTKPVTSAQLVATVLKLAARWRMSQAANNELGRAAEVQRGLLPAQLVSLPGYHLAGGCAPARAVGGDFFDWYAVDGGAVFSLADVMGKGIGAAIIAATVRAVLRSAGRESDMSRSVAAAAASLESDLDQAGAFVTLFHARLDAVSGDIRYVDAGHGLSLVVRADGGAERLRTTSLPLGMGFEDDWPEHTVELSPGDTLVSVSDGVLDLWGGDLGSLDEVERIVRAAPHAQHIVDSLLAMAESGADDDVTVVVLRRD